MEAVGEEGESGTGENDSLYYAGKMMYRIYHIFLHAYISRLSFPTFLFFSTKDWVNEPHKCKTGGGQPGYMNANPGLWMYDTLEACCEARFE